ACPGPDFFFQAEDGIRAFHVTGVQTCALPILSLKTEDAAVHVWLAEHHAGVVDEVARREVVRPVDHHIIWLDDRQRIGRGQRLRSEERRVGKEWRGRRWRCPDRNTLKRSSVTR